MGWSGAMARRLYHRITPVQFDAAEHGDGAHP